MFIFLVILGALLTPRFTLGCVLLYLEFNILGGLIIGWSVGWGFIQIIVSLNK